MVDEAAGYAKAARDKNSRGPAFELDEIAFQCTLP
jgi:hypothetical protein